MLMMIEKEIRVGICHAIHKYAKGNNKYMKNYNENTESSYIMYLDANNLCGWAMSQKLLVNDFKQKKMYLNLMNTSRKIMMKIVKKDIFLKQMLNIQNILLIFVVIFHFYMNERKIKNVIDLLVI